MWKGPHYDYKSEHHFSDPSIQLRREHRDFFCTVWAWMRLMLHDVHPWVPCLWRAATSLWSPSGSCVGCTFLISWHKGIWIGLQRLGKLKKSVEFSFCASSVSLPQCFSSSRGLASILTSKTCWALGTSNAMKIVCHKIPVSCVCHGSKGKPSTVLWGTADT